MDAKDVYVATKLIKRLMDIEFLIGVLQGDLQVCKQHKIDLFFVFSLAMQKLLCKDM